MSHQRIIENVGPLTIAKKTNTGFSQLSGGFADAKVSYDVYGYIGEQWVSEKGLSTLGEARKFAKTTLNNGEIK